MIRIKKGIETEIIVTLTECATIDNPLYWFVVYSFDNTAEDLAFTSTDNSLYPERYNSFTISAAQTTNLTIGDYRYIIYETTDGTANTIIGAAEAGIWQIYEADTVVDTYSEVQTDYTYKG